MDMDRNSSGADISRYYRYDINRDGEQVTDLGVCCASPLTLEQARDHAQRCTAKGEVANVALITQDLYRMMSERDYPHADGKPYVEPEHSVNPDRTAERTLQLALKELRAGNLFRAMHASSEAARKVEAVWQANS
jgi:hypothetical protein